MIHLLKKKNYNDGDYYSFPDYRVEISNNDKILLNFEIS